MVNEFKIINKVDYVRWPQKQVQKFMFEALAPALLLASQVNNRSNPTSFTVAITEYVKYCLA